ncbi:MAG: serine hydrolase [Gemmatimonadota bacterium]|nr:serine hydrolase [Gemmatimonadota bacterium]
MLGASGLRARWLTALVLGPLPFVWGCASEAPDSVGSGAPAEIAAVDTIFARFDGAETPGCAVAASVDGEEVLARAFGQSTLEFDVPNTTTTVFEAGSVSKQLVSAATVLLAVDDRISLDDDIRDYFPEIPDYGEVITVRDLINHTSGLRDWGVIAGIHGWQRTTRRHTHTHTLDIAGRQSVLNYPPGQFYSYTNTGYNLLAVLVERVTGRSLDDFSRERIFEPLGMTQTEWRDDYTEIVPDRATAYRRTADGAFHQLMPFEDIYGNGGLLTTPSDLLRFTHNLETAEVGGPLFVEEMHRQGVLDSGRQIKYAGAVIHGEHRGVREVHHAGATAGYGAFLTRFPEEGVAVAVMCNVAGANPRGLAHEVADLLLGDAIDDAVPAGMSGPPVGLGADELESLAGGYRDAYSGGFWEIEAGDGRLLLNGVPLRPVSDTRFEGPSDYVLEFESPPAEEGRPVGMLYSQVLDRATLEPVELSEPGPARLREYVGTYRSDDAEVTYRIELDGEQLVSRQRYDVNMALRPAYEDAFTGWSAITETPARSGSTFIFRRDAAGRVTGFSMSRGRVWNLRFERVP